MNDKEILQKTIEKAKNNGYKTADHHYHFFKEIDFEYPYFYCNEIYEEIHINEIIFSTDFLKAFWGDKTITVYSSDLFGFKTDTYVYGTSEFKMKSWQYHLQQMVILPDNERLKYIERFLNES